MPKLCLFTLCLFLHATAFGAAVGEAAPDFTLPDLFQKTSNNGAISLNDYRGKVVYLDFWASWCAPCLVSIPLINELRNKYKNEAFEVLAVNVDTDPEDGIDFLYDHPVDYPVVSDPEGLSPALYELIGMPTSFLIDAEGTIRLVHVGFKLSDIDMIEAELVELLEASK